MEAKFKTGDVVRLVSGSPQMVIADRIDTGEGAFAYVCQWVDVQGLPQQQTYVEVTLTLAAYFGQT
jgi:uncharacterized protein YodC (DUF2158 family)